MTTQPMSKAAQWCKSKVGREHTPVVARDSRTLGRLGQCGQHGPKWLCVHHVECGVCGRVLVYEWQMDAADCPDHVD